MWLPVACKTEMLKLELVIGTKYSTNYYLLPKYSHIFPVILQIFPHIPQLPMGMWFPVAREAALLKLELVIETIEEGLVLADADVTVETIIVRD